MATKVISVTELFNINQRSINSNKNRTLDPLVLSKYLPKDDPEMLCPIIFSMIHNDIEMRTVIVVARDRSGTDCQTIQLDMEFKDFKNLKEVTV